MILFSENLEFHTPQQKAFAVDLWSFGVCFFRLVTGKQYNNWDQKPDSEPTTLSDMKKLWIQVIEKNRTCLSNIKVLFPVTTNSSLFLILVRIFPRNSTLFFTTFAVRVFKLSPRPGYHFRSSSSRLSILKSSQSCIINSYPLLRPLL